MNDIPILQDIPRRSPSGPMVVPWDEISVELLEVMGEKSQKSQFIWSQNNMGHVVKPCKYHVIVIL